MAYLTNLADVARRTGFPVVEEWGWRNRGHGSFGSVNSVVCHHDAANLAPWQFNTVVRDGHSSLAGPLSQFTIRQDSTIHVVAAGVAWHAGRNINDAIYGNYHSIGIEANNSGVGEAWPQAQLDAYVALCAELCKEFGISPSRVQGHKEICYPAGRKIDPNGIHMPSFRDAVSQYITNPNVNDEPKPEVEMPASVVNLPNVTPEWQSVSLPWEVYKGSALTNRGWLSLSAGWGPVTVTVWVLGNGGLAANTWPQVNGRPQEWHEVTIPENQRRLWRLPDPCYGVNLQFTGPDGSRLGAVLFGDQNG